MIKYPHLRPYRIIDALIVLGSFFIGLIISIVLYIIQAVFHLASYSSYLHISSHSLSILLQLIVALGVFLATYFFIIKKNHLSVKEFGFKPISFIKLFAYVALGFVMTFAAWIAVAPFIIVFLPGVDLAQSQDIFQKDMTFLAQILMIVYAIIVGPLVEEVIFRGVLLPTLSNKVNLYFGVIVSTLVWSLLHFQLNVIIFTFIFGIILSYQYIYSKSLWTSYLTHVLKNSMAVIAIYAMGLLT